MKVTSKRFDTTHCFQLLSLPSNVETVQEKLSISYFFVNYSFPFPKIQKLLIMIDQLKRNRVIVTSSSAMAERPREA